MERQTREITVYSMATFTAKLAAFNRKADKLGMAPAEVENVVECTERDEWNEEVFTHYLVTLAYDVIKLAGGWKLAASLDHVEFLVRRVPGVEIPSYFTLDAHYAHCDHCQQYRQRNETFVLVDDHGQAVQVGRNCLGLFLGIDAAMLLRQIDLTGSIRDDDEEWTGQRAPRGYDLGYYLANVAAMLRTEGWTSRGQAKDGYKMATADSALSNITNARLKTKDRHGNPVWVDVSKADSALAERAVAWLKALSVRTDDLGDYLGNLAQIGENGYVTSRSAGFAASAINAMLKEEGEELERRTTTKRHLGTVGQKLTGDFTLVNSAGYQGDWGYQFIHIFKDDEGNTVKWSTGVELEQGRKYTVTATVKAHDDYKGVPQTVITRAKAK